MKKILLSLVLVWAVFLLFGCWKDKQEDFAINKVNDLADILARTSEITQEYANGKLSLEEFNTLTAQLEAKYEEIIDIDFDDIDDEDIRDAIDDKFDEMKDTKKEAEFWLPKRAKDRGLSEPEWLTLDTEESNVSSVDVEWFDSVILIYNGDYDKSIQEAKKIAEKANIPVSPEFQAARDALLTMSDDQKILLDLWSEDILKWIIYTNHSLLETNFDKLITISVDEEGELIIEAVNYEQMNK